MGDIMKFKFGQNFEFTEELVTNIIIISSPCQRIMTLVVESPTTNSLTSYPLILSQRGSTAFRQIIISTVDARIQLH